MSVKNAETRERHLHVRLSHQEYQQLETSFKRTTKRKLSQYVRQLLLGKPVTVYSRSQSIDEMLAVLTKIKAELSAVGNNYNQTVKRLHSLTGQMQVRDCAEAAEKSHAIFLQQQAEILAAVKQLLDRWLQE